ncbi:hypothetical protein KY362_08410 [Candidatus Woesearchaeota archaeon]|nr:hypothetical protein [Candidatus Woesearchaeota archaeon]
MAETVIKRKLYKRGSSYETTIPKPMLFARDLSKKQDVLFKFDSESNRWYVDFEEAGETKEEDPGKRGTGKKTKEEKRSNR